MRKLTQIQRKGAVTIAEIPNHNPNPQDGRYSSRYLSRKRVVYWNEPAYTVLTSARDASLHPGVLERKETINIQNYNVTPQLPANCLTVAEMFCGGGLMAVGLKAAGYTLTWANDFDKNAAKAYAANIGDHVICGDITSESVQSTIPDADIFAGGPPCQDYSVAGSGAGEGGERGRLVWTYLSIIERKQPKAFVFENVKGLIQRKHRPTFDALLAQFDAIGYNVSWRLVNAWDYGVAQKRERVFIVGIRKDIGTTFKFPEPAPNGFRTQVLRDVIGDLPEPNSGLNSHIQTQATTIKPTNSLSFQRRYQADWGKAARTVNTNRLDHAEIVPEGDRRFTVRECLRIQSVPDTYVIPPEISLSAAYRIVGNGVASRVAYLIGAALLEQLNGSIRIGNGLNETKSEEAAI